MDVHPSYIYIYLFIYLYLYTHSNSTVIVLLWFLLQGSRLKGLKYQGYTVIIQV